MKKQIWKLIFGLTMVVVVASLACGSETEHTGIDSDLQTCLDSANGPGDEWACNRKAELYKLIANCQTNVESTPLAGGYTFRYIWEEDSIASTNSESACKIMAKAKLPSSPSSHDEIGDIFYNEDPEKVNMGSTTTGLYYSWDGDVSYSATLTLFLQSKDNAKGILGYYYPVLALGSCVEIPRVREFGVGDELGFWADDDSNLWQDYNAVSYHASIDSSVAYSQSQWHLAIYSNQDECPEDQEWCGRLIACGDLARLSDDHN